MLLLCSVLSFTNVIVLEKKNCIGVYPVCLPTCVRFISWCFVIQNCFLVFQEIVLMKGNNPLGFSIVGGSDHASHPFGLDEPGIFISKVVCNGGLFSLSSFFEKMSKMIGGGYFKRIHVAKPQILK